MSAHAAPDGLDGPPNVVTIPVFWANSLEVGSSFIVGGAEFLNPASSSKINGDQINGGQMGYILWKSYS